MSKVLEFLYRLFFTRDDDLDVLQIVFLLHVIFVDWCVYKVFSRQWQSDTGAWAILGSVFATLAIVGVPRWAAELLAKRQERTAFARRLDSWRTDDRFYGVDAPEDLGDA